MPIYEYFCESCKKKYEVLVFSGDETCNRRTCSMCGKNSLTRLFSRFAFSKGTKNTGNQSSSGNSSCATCSGGNCSTCAR